VLLEVFVEGFQEGSTELCSHAPLLSYVSWGEWDESFWGFWCLGFQDGLLGHCELIVVLAIHDVSDGMEANFVEGWMAAFRTVLTGMHGKVFACP
jgi:hypothetical protein